MRATIRTMRRCLLVSAVAVIAACVTAPAADAKATPHFTKQVAAPGERVGVVFDRGIESYLAPLEVYLVSTKDEPFIRGRGDRRLTRVGTLGRRGMILRPATLVFRVPEMAHGSYTLAVFFVGSATGRWANAVPGLWRDSQLGPRLVLRVSH